METTSTIFKVTLYSDKAQIFRNSKVNLEKGIQKITITDLPNTLEEASIQVRLTTGILHHIHAQNTKSKTEIPAAIQTLIEEMQKVELKIQQLETQHIRLVDEQKFINAIKNKVTTSNSGSADFIADNWTSIINLTRQQLSSTDEMIRNKKDEIQQAQKMLAEISLTIAKHGYTISGERLIASDKNKEIQITIECEKACSSEVLISYMQPGASWTPAYDIRVSSESKKLQLSYVGLVTQHTGEDWTDAQLILSTAKPNQSGPIPTFRPWYIQKAIQEDYDAMPKPGSISKSSSMKLKMEESFDEVSIDKFTQVKSQANSVTYEIQHPASIRSGETNIRTTIMQKIMECEFSYHIFPSKSSFAYLMVSIRNNTEYPLLQGQAHIFMDGNFTSKVIFKKLFPTELLELSLGIDEGIKVEYNHLNTFEKKEGIFAKKRKIIDRHSTTIQNLKSNEFSFIVTEQYPISTDQEILIELIEPKNAEKTEQHLLIRRFSLKAGEKSTLPLEYSIEFPQNLNLDGLPTLSE